MDLLRNLRIINKNNIPICGLYHQHKRKGWILFDEGKYFIYKKDSDNIGVSQNNETASIRAIIDLTRNKEGVLTSNIKEFNEYGSQIKDSQSAGVNIDKSFMAISWEF